MSPSDTPVSTIQCYGAKINQVQTRLLSSGNLLYQQSTAPVVNIIPSSNFTNGYDVLIIMYLPDNAQHVDLDKTNYPCLDTIEDANTEAGILPARVIAIDYDTPGYEDPVKDRPEVFLYSIWQMKISYTVVGKPAHAIWVRYTIDDPRTTRGTVTTVEKA